MLHQEIERLPQKHRDAIVLFYLEGLTLETAAQQLQCPSATLGVRLMRARDKLRRRLSRRGVTAPAAVLSALGLARPSAAAVLPYAMVRSTAARGLQLAGARTISLVTTELIGHVVRRLILVRLARVSVVLVLAVALTTSSRALLSGSGLSAEERPAPTAQPEPPGRAGSPSPGHLPQHPVVLWKFPTFGDPGTLLFADGVIYVGDRLENFYAISLKDRGFLWRARGLGHIYLPAARQGDTVYVTSREGLTALSAQDGKVRWNDRLRGDPMSASPLVVKDRVVAADDAGRVYALSLDGKRIWEHDLMDTEDLQRERDMLTAIRAQLKRPGIHGATNPRPPVSDGTTVFLPLFDKSHRLLAIDVARGFRRWTFHAAGMIYGQPTLADDMLFFGCYEGDAEAKTGRFYGLNTKRRVLWEFPTTARIDANSAYRDGSIYFGTSGGQFFRLDARTGKEVWSYQIPDAKGTKSAIYCTPLCTADAVYFNSFDGHLYCLDRATGAFKWRFQPIAGSELDLSLATDGERIIVGARRNTDAQTGENAIVAIGEAQEQVPGRRHRRNKSGRLP